MRKAGTIESLNVSPKGFFEGFLLRTGKKIVQINLPKEDSGRLGSDLNPGQQVTAEVESEEPRGEPKHEVFLLVRFADAKGRLAEDHEHSSRHFFGCVESLNYARHGEVNGGMLDSGDFLHLKPEGARALKLKAGMQVEGHGNSKSMVGGHSVIDAEEVNGTLIPHHAPKKHAAKHSQH
jgi:hypothetical protein